MTVPTPSSAIVNLTAGRLTATDLESNLNLQRLIAAAIAPDAADSASPSSAVSAQPVSRRGRSGRRLRGGASGQPATKGCESLLLNPD
jgi:hypothetical protein